MKILVADDDKVSLEVVGDAFRGMGHSVKTAQTPAQTEKQIRNDRFQVVWIDPFFDGKTGFHILDLVQDHYPNTEVVVFTSEMTIDAAIKSVRKGALEFIQKPFVPERAERILERIRINRGQRAKLTHLEHQLSDESPVIELSSNEPEVQRIYDMALKAAKSDASILLLGPSGTGKTVLARNIHAYSNRAEEMFMTIHCPSLSAELLESELFGHVKGAFTGAVRDVNGKVGEADGGTVFLDEIGELPARIQSKLLRLLQEGEYERVGDTETRRADVRIIAATNKDLQAAVETGSFREDLFYRLNVITMTLPPLASRQRDLMPLAENYLRFFAQRTNSTTKRFNKKAKEVILRYPWPGNIRELRNVIERAIIFCEGEEIPRKSAGFTGCNRHLGAW